ncbi:DUF6252 family protein [Rubrolithibacter danxiaensis]|uniref:DUF6252 family protein n=1 Tax=Rubrolithibacter danxiaensis TaxID=3390805 RepID=UPI003BF7CC75
MRKIKLAFLMFTLCLFVFSSCKKDKETSKAEAGMSVKIDGTLKASNAPAAATIYQSENTIQIIGRFSSSEGISIMLNEVKTGEFDVATDAALVAYMEGTDPDQGFLGETGTVKITSLTDEMVKGTFEFTAKRALGEDVRVITEGTFEAKVIKL